MSLTLRVKGSSSLRRLLGRMPSGPRSFIPQGLQAVTSRAVEGENRKKPEGSKSSSGSSSSDSGSGSSSEKGSSGESDAEGEQEKEQRRKVNIE